MILRNLRLALGLALVFGVANGVFASSDNSSGGGNPSGGSGPGGKRHHHGDGSGFIKMILKNADELKLTDDQKKDLEALMPAAPAPGGDATATAAAAEDIRAKANKILTPDQIAKVKEMFHRGDGPGKDGGTPPSGTGQGNKTPATTSDDQK